jgi:tRNA C32,U32 (ribose-2'-O)-methylase TrmJ
VGVLAVSAGLAGCGKKGVNTSNLQSSFKSADAATQGDVDKVISAIKAGNYPEAMTDLQRLAAKAKLTAEQQQAIKDVMTQVQQQMTEAANKAAGELKKSLPLGK